MCFCIKNFIQKVRAFVSLGHRLSLRIIIYFWRFFLYLDFKNSPMKNLIFLLFIPLSSFGQLNFQNFKV